MQAMSLILHLGFAAANLAAQHSFYDATSGTTSSLRAGRGIVSLMLCIIQAAVLILCTNTRNGRGWRALVFPPSGTLWEAAVTSLALAHFLGVGTVEYSQTLYKACEESTPSAPTSCSDVVSAFTGTFSPLSSSNCSAALSTLSLWLQQPASALCNDHFDPLMHIIASYDASVSLGASVWHPGARIADVCCGSCTAAGYTFPPVGCVWESGSQTPFASSVVQPLSFVDGLYFSVVITTTVGYGHAITPATPGGRIFTMYYSIAGLVLFALAASKFSATYGALRARLAALLDAHRCGRDRQWFPRLTLHKAASADAASSFEQFAMVLRVLLKFLVLNFVSAAIFTRLQPAWGFSDAIYHCMMTASTVGLGDIGPTTQGARGFAIVHMVASVLIFGDLIGCVSSVVEVKRQSERRKALLQQQMSPQLIKSLDATGDGKIDKAEFALGMLIKLDLVAEADVKPFFERFDTIDTAHAGSVSVDALAEHGAAVSQKSVGLETAGRHTTDGRNEPLYAVAATWLVAVAFIACLNFLWNTVYGYVMLASGLFDALLVFLTLTSDTAPAKLLPLIGLSLLATFSWLATTTLWLLWNVPQSRYLYYRADPFAFAFEFGFLDSNGVATHTPAYAALDTAAGAEQSVQATSEMYRENPAWAVMVVMYTLFYVGAIIVNVRFLLLLLRCRCTPAATVADASTSGYLVSVSP